MALMFGALIVVIECVGGGKKREKEKRRPRKDGKKNGRNKKGDDKPQNHDVIRPLFSPSSLFRRKQQFKPNDYSPVSDVWFDETKHLLSGLGDSDEDTVVDLKESEKLEDLSWLWGDFGDTVVEGTRSRWRLVYRFPRSRPTRRHYFSSIHRFTLKSH